MACRRFIEGSTRNPNGKRIQKTPPGFLLGAFVMSFDYCSTV